MDELQAWIEQTAKLLVDDPEEVSVADRGEDKEGRREYEIRVRSRYMGQVIGAGGCHGEAIRLLARTIARAHDNLVIVKIVSI